VTSLRTSPRLPEPLRAGDRRRHYREEEASDAPGQRPRARSYCRPLGRRRRSSVGPIGALAHVQQLSYSIVMKAVMDHADPDKSDNFKPFAARASAEVLIAFLRQNLPLRSAEREGASHTQGTMQETSRAGLSSLERLRVKSRASTA
jgi:hypothetical protein